MKKNEKNCDSWSSYKEPNQKELDLFVSAVGNLIDVVFKPFKVSVKNNKNGINYRFKCIASPVSSPSFSWKSLLEVFSPIPCEDKDIKLVSIFPLSEKWEAEDINRVDLLISNLNEILLREDKSLSKTGILLQEALCEVCNPLLNPDIKRRKFWYQYRDGKIKVTDFFYNWLHYIPVPYGNNKSVKKSIAENVECFKPNSPGYYIELWDYLSNTKSGLELNNNDKAFRKWFVDFLNLRGHWLNCYHKNLNPIIEEWEKYKGSDEHPFDIKEYVVPEDNFKSFNEFFLRELKPGVRPLCPCSEDPDVIVSPCDGGAFYLTHGQMEESAFALPGKSHDILKLKEALPGFGGSFIGGPVLDILLWFTDYHHFNAPVSGTVIHQGVYQGSYNYDFDDYDSNDPYMPALTDDSDRVGWYKNLAKHKRYVWIFRTQNLGLVAMIAIGFWGVGSVISEVPVGAALKKGDKMGHFGYGGSSIVLAFEPELNIQFGVQKKIKNKKIYLQELSGPDNPVLIKVNECLGRRMSIPDWPL